MHFVYLLHSIKDEALYVGQTGNLKQRLAEHQRGKNPSTKHRRPLKLIFYESFASKQDALRREKYFKTSKGKSSLKQMLRESLR